MFLFYTIVILKGLFCLLNCFIIVFTPLRSLRVAGYRHIRFIASPGFTGFHSRCPPLVTCPQHWWGTRDHHPVSFPTPCLNEIQHALPYKIHNNCSEIGSKSHLAISPGTPNTMKCLCFWIVTYLKMASWIHTAPSSTRVLAPHRATSLCFYHICKMVLPFLFCPLLSNFPRKSQLCSVLWSHCSSGKRLLQGHLSRAAGLSPATFSARALGWRMLYCQLLQPQWLVRGTVGTQGIFKALLNLPWEVQ